MKSCWSWLANLLFAIPGFSGLKYVKQTIIKKSLVEFFVCLTAAWSPTLIGAMVRMLQKSEEFFPAVQSQITGSELYIYICSLLGSLAYVLIEFHFRKARFPDFVVFMLFTCSALVVSLVIHVSRLAGTISNAPFTNTIAIITYGLAMLFWLLSILYRNIEVNYTDTTSDTNKQKEMMDELEGFNG